MQVHIPWHTHASTHMHLKSDTVSGDCSHKQSCLESKMPFVSFIAFQKQEQLGSGNAQGHRTET